MTSRLAAVPIAFMVLLCTGCTHKAWYEMLREQQRQMCYRQPNQTTTTQCLDRVNNMSYEQYNRLLEESIKQPK